MDTDQTGACHCSADPVMNPRLREAFPDPSLQQLCSEQQVCRMKHQPSLSLSRSAQTTGYRVLCMQTRTTTSQAALYTFKTRSVSTHKHHCKGTHSYQQGFPLPPPPQARFSNFFTGQLTAPISIKCRFATCDIRNIFVPSFVEWNFENTNGPSEQANRTWETCSSLLFSHRQSRVGGRKKGGLTGET